MYIFDYKEDIIKDKPIDERGVPEILFEAAAEVDRVAPLASLGAVEGEVRRGDRRQERDPGQLDSRAAHAPGETLHADFFHYLGHFLFGVLPISK